MPRQWRRQGPAGGREVGGGAQRKSSGVAESEQTKINAIPAPRRRNNDRAALLARWSQGGVCASTPANIEGDYRAASFQILTGACDGIVGRLRRGGISHLQDR